MKNDPITYLIENLPATISESLEQTLLTRALEQQGLASLTGTTKRLTQLKEAYVSKHISETGLVDVRAFYQDYAWHLTELMKLWPY